MQKIICFITALLLTLNITQAESIDKEISASNVNRGAVSISVRDLETGRVVYSHNSNKPMNPASTLKTITYASALNELGEDYEFTTALYKNTNNELILKLGADPFLDSKDLKKLTKAAVEKNILEPKAIIIDDSVIDNVEWGEGWQWDDDLNPLMPKFSAYNIDKNLLTVQIIPTYPGTPADIQLVTFYPVTFMNHVISKDGGNAIKLSRNNSIAPDVLKLEGSVDKQTEKTFPVNYPKRYFLMRFGEAIHAARIDFGDDYKFEKLPTKNVYLVDKITNPISEASEEVLKNSNNMVAESVFKIAGGHHAKGTGTAENGTQMVYDYCDKLNINHNEIRIVDGSGVSKNNLVTADFMTKFLTEQYKNNQGYKDLLPTSGEGTLKNRMLYFKNNLRAKTGTLTDVSAIAGYITTQKGKTYAFDIMINDPKSKPSEKKMLEEYLLRAINASL